MIWLPHTCVVTSLLKKSIEICNIFWSLCNLANQYRTFCCSLPSFPRYYLETCCLQVSSTPKIVHCCAYSPNHVLVIVYPFLRIRLRYLCIESQNQPRQMLGLPSISSRNWIFIGLKISKVEKAFAFLLNKPNSVLLFCEHLCKSYRPDARPSVVSLTSYCRVPIGYRSRKTPACTVRVYRHSEGASRFQRTLI